MRSNPLVSVIIPTHNRPTYLREATISVLNQDYSNIELIIVDDCSQKPAENVIRDITVDTNITDIKIIRHKENQGANVARNTGISNATGEFIAFLDDDDRWEPSKLKRQIMVFQNTSDRVGVVYTGQRGVNEKGETTAIRVSKTSGRVTKDLLSDAWIPPFSCVMVRKDVIKQAGRLDERFPSLQDREWYVRLSQYCEFKAIPEPLVVRRTGSYGKIGDNHDQKRNISYPLFLKKYRPLAREYGYLFEKKMISEIRKSMGKSALKRERYNEARQFFLKAIRTYPITADTYVYLLVALAGRPGYLLAKTAKNRFEGFWYTDQGG